jgi:hypothetical protein
MMQTSTQLISAWPYAKPRIVLREQLLSQSNLPPSPRDHHAKTMQENSSPTSPSDQGINDPTTGGSGVMSTSADSDGGGDNGGDGRKGYGKRELSTSKRAAQNRAAQVSWHDFSGPARTVQFPVCHLPPIGMDCPICAEASRGRFARRGFGAVVGPATTHE